MTRTAPPLAADERATYTALLDYLRATIELKVEGLADEDAARAVLPSKLTTAAGVSAVTRVLRSLLVEMVPLRSFSSRSCGQGRGAGGRDGVGIRRGRRIGDRGIGWEHKGFLLRFAGQPFGLSRAIATRTTRAPSLLVTSSNTIASMTSERTDAGAGAKTCLLVMND